MIFKVLPVGPMGANCYIIGCEETKKAAIVDPGGDTPKIIREVEALGLTPEAIVLTHGHIDHIFSVDEVRDETKAKVYIHEDDAEMLTDSKKNLSFFMGQQVGFKAADETLADNEELAVGSLTLKIIHTPGHTPGGICIQVENYLITGDTLFAGSVGRSDFPGGSHEVLINSIKEKLLTLPENLKVYPGHGPSSTLAGEKRSNPFL